jgi:hypothetical protein
VIKCYSVSASKATVFTVITIISLCLASPARGQLSKGSFIVPDSNTVQIVTMRDGSSFIGRTMAVSDTTVTIKTDMGVLTLPISKIESIKEVAKGSVKGGKYWFPNTNQTRLFVGPTGRMLKKGDGYISDIYAFFPGFSYGITNNITIGGGFSLFPGVGFDKQLFYLTPRIGTALNQKLSVAASALIVRVPVGGGNEFDNATTVGVLFGSATLGSSDNGFTAGLGFGFADGKFADKPAVELGGEFRVARRLAFVTENWIFPEVDEPLMSYGMRFLGEKLTVDLALFNLLGDDAVFPGIPYIDFVWNF